MYRIALGRMAAVDHSAPVMALQKQLASIRRFYGISGLWAGLPWWFLWMPIMAMLVKVGTGVNMFERAQAVLDEIAAFEKD